MKSSDILVVDLDGTLINSDMLHETILRLFHASPLSVFKIPFWLLQGKANLKRRVAEQINFDPSKLPFNKKLIEWLLEQRNLGRRLVLCTASHISIANSISEYLGFFDEIIATDGLHNVAGKNKANALVDRFGEGGFDYVGNSAADIHVWEYANKAIIVNASEKVLLDAKACVNVELVFGGNETNNLSPWMRALRLHQWMKNFLLFIPFLASHRPITYLTLNSLLFAFLSFSLCASSVYLVNDLFDLENDRSHPRKTKRPFASGDLPVWKGALVAPILLLASFLLSTKVNQAFTICLSTYFILTCLYSLKLKQVVLIDCISLSILYTLRIVAGALALGSLISFWILAFSVFLFLSLAFVKRFAELQVQLLHGKHGSTGRGYFSDDAPLIQTLGVVSGFLSSLVLALYLNSQKVVELYSSPEWIWGCVPILIFWISWVWLQAHRGEMHDDPLVFALKDKTSLISGTFFTIFLILGAFL